MKTKLLSTSIATLFLAMGTAHARGMTVDCKGEVGWYKLRAYTAISNGPEDNCIFITRSRIGRRILRTCPTGSQCLIEADIENVSDEYEITRVISINRIGTPALDAKAAKDQATREKSRWLAVSPYFKEATSCVMDNQDALEPASPGPSPVNILLSDGVCSKVGKALRNKLIQQFSYPANYIDLNYKTELQVIINKHEPESKWWLLLGKMFGETYGDQVPPLLGICPNEDHDGDCEP